MWKVSTLGETEWVKFYNNADTYRVINVAVAGGNLFAHFESEIIALIDISNGAIILAKQMSSTVTKNEELDFHKGAIAAVGSSVFSASSIAGNIYSIMKITATDLTVERNKYLGDSVIDNFASVKGPRGICVLQNGYLAIASNVRPTGSP